MNDHSTRISDLVEEVATLKARLAIVERREVAMARLLGRTAAKAAKLAARLKGVEERP